MRLEGKIRGFYMSGRGSAGLLPVLVLAVVFGLSNLGCASIAEKVAGHLAEKDVKALDHEFSVFETDLGLFHKCLKERGGTCAGSDSTALPHTSQATTGQGVASVRPGESAVLTGSVAALPAGHAAKSSHAVLTHPVVAQAAALHNHLRGHSSGSVQGFSVKSGQGADGTSESTATMSMGVGKVQDFHSKMMSSSGTTAWESLHGHCAQLLANHGSSPGRTELEADCRRVAFIRGYLGAYFRSGQFLEVQLGLAGAVQAVKNEGTKVKTDIESLQTDLKNTESELAKDEAKSLQELGTDAGTVATEVQSLVKKVEADLSHSFGDDAAKIFTALSGLTADLTTKSSSLAQAADQKLSADVKKLVSDLDEVLGKVAAELTKLEAKAESIDSKLVDDINNETGKVDQKLSNVFKVSSVGFVSRDDTFQAKLPTLDIKLDPTAGPFLTVTDESTNETLAKASSLSDLGVATDSSGVGTGSSIGAEVVRVFLEAVFDAHEGLPAVAPANQPSIKPTGLDLGEYSLPLFSSPLGNVDGSDLTHMTHTNNQVAAKTRAIMSRILAGIGPFSLNNQPLEDFIVEIITTSVRQATSKATWCWYACNLNVDVEKLEADAKTAVEDKAKAVEGEAKAKLADVQKKVEGKAKELEEKGRSEGARLESAGERVKLRLQLTK